MVYGVTVQATIIVSSFTGVNCLSHPIFDGANCLSHRVLSFFAGVNCLSHPIFYGANCSNHHVISLSRVLTVWATLFCTVLTVQANIVVAFYVSYPLFFMVLLVRVTMLLAFSRVLTVWATLFSMVLTVQATMFLAFSRVLTVWATLFCTVLTVQATFLLLVMWAIPLFLWSSLLEPLWYSFPQGRSKFGALQYYLFRCRYMIRSSPKIILF